MSLRAKNWIAALVGVVVSVITLTVSPVANAGGVTIKVPQLLPLNHSLATEGPTSGEKAPPALAKRGLGRQVVDTVEYQIRQRLELLGGPRSGQHAHC